MESLQLDLRNNIEQGDTGNITLDSNHAEKVIEVTENVSSSEPTNNHPRKITENDTDDFEYEHQCQGTTEVSKKQKLFLMSWCPDTARIKKKMLYSSSFDALKKALVGVHKYIQVS